MPQGRRSRLIIRRVDPWTILKFSALLYLSAYFVILVAGIVLWSVASASGVRGNIESFVSELIASENFEFKSSQILKSSVYGGAVLVVVGTFFNVLLAVLFNLISDVVGGIGISVEERPPRPGKAKKRASSRLPSSQNRRQAGGGDEGKPGGEKRFTPTSSLVKREREP